MRKIAVGAFPLVQIDKNERKMVENYLINTLSDLINVNQLSADINSDRAKFITPMSILNFIKDNKDKFMTDSVPPRGEPFNESEDKGESKAKVIRRAFKNTKSLYSAISNDPFYKDNVFYPIYIEETIKANSGYIDYKYDFLILSNDLVKKQILDEIQYDDRITLLFLILKCVLLPYTKLSDIGTTKNSVSDIRKYFAVYLETCKNGNINPIDMFVKIINLAGIQKRMNKGGKPTNKLLGLLTTLGVSSEKANKIHSANFLNLFDTKSEIKDAYFLTGLSQMDISKFIDDDAKMDPNYNVIGRQYAQAKTHEYGKILSIIDALKVFNNAQNMVQDLNTNDITQKIKLNTNGNEVEVSINIDQILNDVEVTYFRQFLIAIQKRDLVTVRKIYKALDLPSEKNTIKEDEQSILSGINMTTAEITSIQKDIDSIKNDIDRLRDHNGNVVNVSLFRQYEMAIKNLTDRRLASEKTLKALQDNLSVFRIAHAHVDMNMSKEDEQKATFSTYQISLEEFSAYLTGLYAQLYSYFNSQEFLNDIQNSGNVLMTLDDFRDLPIYKRVFAMDLSEISGLFQTHYQRKFDVNEKTLSPDEKTLFYRKFKKANDVKNIVSNVLAKNSFNVLNQEGMEELFFENLIQPIFKKYSNSAMVTANQIKDLRIEKNPLLKKLFNNANLFKAFILTDTILIQAYDILHYLDNLKYEVGLINIPVSKVFNNQNKIQFMINRLGLNDYPVFIMNTSRISLSMPNHLSMTGNNFISTVSASAFKEIATINHVKVWNSMNMFGGITKNKDFTKLQAGIDKISKEIKVAEIALSKIKDVKAKANALKNIDKLKAEQERKRIAQQRLREENSNPYNFSPNMERSVRENNNRPTPGRDYRSNIPNTNVFNRGQNNQMNYNPDEARNGFLQGRDSVEGLQNQPTVDYNQQNRFINNPFIQNRINELNNNN